MRIDTLSLGWWMVATAAVACSAPPPGVDSSTLNAAGTSPSLAGNGGAIATGSGSSGAAGGCGVGCPEGLGGMMSSLQSAGAGGGGATSFAGTGASGMSSGSGVAGASGSSAGTNGAGTSAAGAEPLGGSDAGGAGGVPTNSGGLGGEGGEPSEMGGAPNIGGAGGANAGSGGENAGDCPYQGNVTYTLARAANPDATQTAAYTRITDAMEIALEYYNCYTDITKELNVQFEPSVPTADGNPNGSLRFGSTASMNFVTAMHEVGHTVGVGVPEMDAMMVNGVFQGPIATAELRDITGDPAAEVHGDDQHFWPYGLNYESEWESEQDGINHCRMVVALRKDIGYD